MPDEITVAKRNTLKAELDRLEEYLASESGRVQPSGSRFNAAHMRQYHNAQSSAATKRAELKRLER
jgi:hypothetical protein